MGIDVVLFLRSDHCEKCVTFVHSISSSSQTIGVVLYHSNLRSKEMFERCPLAFSLSRSRSSIKEFIPMWSKNNITTVFIFFCLYKRNAIENSDH